ncbi:MAG TPA: ATP-binding protein [Ramlibacter sp.]|nr:ATP-binding protein [Ramlibacter sp.]
MQHSALLSDPPVRLDAHWVTDGFRRRVLSALGAALLALIAVMVAGITTQKREASQHEARQATAAVQHMLEERSQHEVQAMRSLIESLLRDGPTTAAFRDRDRGALLARTTPFYEGIRSRNSISRLSFHLPDRTNLLRMHAPERHGDRIDRYTLTEAQITGKPFWAKEAGTSGSFFLRVVYPWVDAGELLGFVEMGVDFGHIADEIKSALEADLYVAVLKSRLEAAGGEGPGSSRRPVDFEEFPELVVLARTAPIPQALRDYLSLPTRSDARRTFEVTLNGETAQALAIPLMMDGQRHGELVAIKQTSEIVQRANTAILRATSTTLTLGLLLMVVGYFYLGRVQGDLASRTRKLDEAREVIATEHDQRLRAERDLAMQQERNELLEERNALLEGRSRMVEELTEAKRVAEAALQENEKVTAELRQAQGLLITTAREAGRAEIATNVLHNVGNVLNSVNVSTGLLGTALRTSRLPKLARALALMDEHGDDLGAFFSNDEKGRKLPAYLRGVVEALGQEQQGMEAEVKRLTNSVDHIKDIVATQQTHAKGGTIIEPVRPAELMEEALRMQGSALARHGIVVASDFATLPALPLDRSHILQILVNLISNAKNAMSDTPDGNRKLTLQVGLGEAGRLRFVVKDQGEGISTENLTRIFTHGFTTRRTGHGFGLHSSALAARQMGGDLTAHSDGPNKGATFVLELPAQAA